MFPSIFTEELYMGHSQIPSFKFDATRKKKYFMKLVEQIKIDRCSQGGKILKLSKK